MRSTVRLLVLLAALLVPAASASAFSLQFGGDSAARALTAAEPEPHPLEGEGEGLELVANLPLVQSGSSPAASDIELWGPYAFIGSYTEGMVIADISDPLHPERIATFSCGGGSQYDVQLHPDLKFAVLSTDSKNATCFPKSASGATQEGSMIIDLSDITSPTLVAAIPMPVGSHTQTLDGNLLYINNYPTSYHRLEIFDLTNPASPQKLSELDFGAGEDSVHDLITDHRPDGRTLVYAASIAATDVIDVTDPRQPRLLQRINDPNVSISHQAEPNHERDVLIVTDEFSGGGESPYCGQIIPADEPTGLISSNLTNVGALHFYGLEPDGTISANGTGDGKLGYFNLLTEDTVGNTGGCTVHVFWQAPDQNRLVTAWYGRGIRVVDFEDPADAAELAWFIPEGADTWAAKPHCGYVFTGDIVRGMDVLRYTGDGWPASAGSMNDQRTVQQGNFSGPAAGGCPGDGPPPATTSGGDQSGGAAAAPGSGDPAGSAAQAPAAAPAARAGGADWRTRFKVPGKRGRKRTLTVTFFDSRLAITTKLRFKARAGKVKRLRGQLAGRPGRYRYIVRLGDEGRVLRRGSVRVRKGSTARFAVPDGQPLVCRIL